MRPLFIIGTGRCGSTVLYEMLAEHPDVGFISNVDSFFAPLRMKGRWNSWLYRVTPRGIKHRDLIGGGLLKQTRLHYGPSEGWELFRREVSAVWVDPFRDLSAEDVTPWLAQRFRAFFERRTAAQKKSHFVHKYTGWPRTGFIHRILPQARFVHVIRDGRAVASSLIQRHWWRGHLGPERWGFGPLPEAYRKEWERYDRSFVALAGLEWMLLMDSFDATRELIPGDQWLDVRFEDLLDDPRDALGRVLDFDELEWTPQFERAFRSFPFSGGRKDRFRKELTAAQVGMLDELLAGHLRRFGYPTAGGRRSERQPRRREASP